MRIYTRKGDGGQTSLFRGGRVSKSSARVEAYGCLDELNAHLGLLRAGLQQRADLPPSLRDPWSEQLGRIQGWLLEAGSLLAAAVPDRSRPAGFPERAAAELEQAIDGMEAELPTLRNFILPGGDPLAGQVHVARTVARRAERRVVALHLDEPVSPAVLAFLNRLSDYLFVLARAVNHVLGTPEEPWNPPSPDSPPSTLSQT